MGKFEELYGINVNEKTEKKGKFTYLSWTWAWAEFKKAYPDANYKINKFDGTYCTGNEKIGYMVSTEVTAGNQSYEMWLPIMDSGNKTLLQPKMTDVNKSIMRCLTKNLAMFGLGLYIYSGEDLPEINEKPDDDDNNVNSIKSTQNKPKKEPKTEYKNQSFVPITRDEIMREWGVKNVEETIVWFEGKFGVEFSNWGEEETEMARMKLSEKKKMREAEELRKKGMARIDDSDLPFSLGD